MASKGGVAKRTYCNYESGEREPGAAFLQALGEYGMDVQYILTGIRSIVQNSQDDDSIEPQRELTNVLVSSQNITQTNAVKNGIKQKETISYGNLDVAVENLRERPSSTRNLDAKEAQSPPNQAQGEYLDRDRMKRAIRLVEEGFRVRKFSPAKKAEVILACYDLLGQWEGEGKAEAFTRKLEDLFKTVS